jgi:sugar O-acyltransferase (sialic acid O-acetyltransferase NeuD family)
MKQRALVIIGDSAFAEVAFEYFDAESDYRVVGFAVERAYLTRSSFHGLPVVAFEDLEQHFGPATHEVYVATVYTQLNRLRTRLAAEAKARGYRLASFVSPRAQVWRNAVLGEHCFIFEHNTVQPFVVIGDNVVLWSGNHIGHHSVIEANCFVSSQVVVSGFCRIGENSFLGVNAMVANNVTLGRDNWVAPGVAVMKDTADGTLFKAATAEISPISSLRFFKVRAAPAAATATAAA